MLDAIYSIDLCKYIISNQQEELLVIFENFSDKVNNPEDNIFFIQNEILDKILTNIEECKKNLIGFDVLYKGLTEDEIELISTLKLEEKINENVYHCSIIGVEYFNEKLFMDVLTKELDNIVNKYNLNSDDDYNKLYKFLSSIKLTLQSSDDMLTTLSNQYIFLYEHSKYSNNNFNEEVITIYENKHYKIDLLKKIIETYNSVIVNQNKVKKTKARKNR